MYEIENMSNKELLKEYKVYDDLIHGMNPCYGTKDTRYLLALERELNKREE